MAISTESLFDPCATGRNRAIYPLPCDTQEVILCSACQDLFVTKVLHSDSNSTWGHHAKLPDLHDAVDKHCYFCTRISESLQPWEESSLSASRFVTLVQIRPQTLGSFTVAFLTGAASNPTILNFSLLSCRGNVMLCDSQEARTNVEARISLQPSGTMIPQKEPTYAIAESTGHPESLNLIKIWLNQCIQSHDACKKIFASVGFPKRLLNVGSLHDASCRLETIQESASWRPRYLALSHCWGDEAFSKYMPRLTGETLNTYEAGLSLSDLPLTFQQAIHVTRYLDFQYIWIDSLCILQDSNEEWTQQAEIMAQIYHLAELTLCATKAKNASEGCFMLRNPRDLLPRTIRLSLKPGDSVHEHIIVDKSYLISRVLNSVLNSRGWVLQERFASRRKIHFTNEQLYWECSQRQACEIFPAGIPVDMADGHTRAFQQGLEQAFVISRLFEGPTGIWPKERAQRAIYLLWRDLVCRYMALKLTKSKDKLPAISSLANVLGVVTKDTYHAGIWADDVPFGLLWRVDLRRADSVKPDCYRAPSWSWASLDAFIYEYYVRNAPDDLDGLDGLYIRNLSFLVDADTSDIESQERKLWLRLEGYLFKLKVDHNVSIKSTEHIEVMRDRIYLYPDQRSFVTQGDLFFLPVLHTESSFEVSSGMTACFRGLLLNISTAMDRFDNEYIRVGFAYIMGQEILDTIKNAQTAIAVPGFNSIIEYTGQQELYLI